MGRNSVSGLVAAIIEMLTTFAHTPAAASVVYVDATATGAGSGAS